MKIQIMGGKITENLGFESPLRKVKNVLSFLSVSYALLTLLKICNVVLLFSIYPDREY